MSKPTRIVLIAAVARNGVIGRDNTLPWRLKADLAHFKRSTLGHPILMGRKTWESLGRPLPGRRNMVISRQSDYDTPGAERFGDPDSALAAAGGETVFVIGGGELYRQLMSRADALVLTEIAADVEGDAHFPDFDREAFIEVSREAHQTDADNDFDYAFVEYRRRTPA